MTPTPKIPNQVQDANAVVSPYEVPAKIWEAIRGYFEDKYSVTVIQTFTEQQVGGPTIFWAYRFMPGQGNNSNVTAKGPTFSRYLPKTPNNYVVEAYVQSIKFFLEYTIAANSPAIVDDLSWDLQNSVLETVGLMQTYFSGFNLVWEESANSSSMIRRTQDSLNTRSIRFQGTMLVESVASKLELRQVQIEMQTGRTPLLGSTFTRTSMENIYNLAEENQYVSDILAVYVKTSDGFVKIHEGTDYKKKRKSNDQTGYYIEWIDSHGRVPQLNDEFRVDYSVSTTRSINTVNPRQ
jgi:hypothetical protein